MTPRQELAELVRLFRELRANLEQLPETPSRKTAALVDGYTDQADALARRVRELVQALPPPPLTEIEVDALDAALSEAMIALHRRFGGFLRPRIS